MKINKNEFYSALSFKPKSKKIKPGKLTLEHIKSYNKELEKIKLKPKPESPILLPDYRREELKAKRLDVF